ncbi:hypothetical protein Tco_1206523 [Tanacetum coccineum]
MERCINILLGLDMDGPSWAFHGLFLIFGSFADFGVTELDELGPIIENKKNKIVGELIVSLGKRYERLKKIPEELGIQSALPVCTQA